MRSAKLIKRMDQPAQVFLPDEILLCIFTILDVRDVVRCRYVCKRWKDLTSTPQFEDLLSNLPMILAKNRRILPSGPTPHNYTYREFCIDQWWGTRTPIHKEIDSNVVIEFGSYDLPRSQNGFILRRIKDQARYEYIIHNPMTGEEVKILLKNEPPDPSLQIFGIYLHPTRKEYCTLWQHDTYNNYFDEDRFKQYKLLTMGSNPPIWRNIDYPRNHWPLGRPHILDAVYSLNHGFMYWLEVNNSEIRVMAFDIDTEDLTPMPLPDNYHDNIKHPSSLVVNGDGCVSLVNVDLDKDIAVQIWTLERRFWTSSQRVHHFHNHWGITYGRYPVNYPKAIAIINGELLITGLIRIEEEIEEDGVLIMINEDESIQLFVCNLQSETITKLEENKEYDLGIKFCAHYPTIASLRSRLQPVIETDMI